MTNAQEIVNQIADFYSIKIGEVLTISPTFHTHLQERGGFRTICVGDKITIKSIYPFRDRADEEHPETPSFTISFDKGGITCIYLPYLLEMREHKLEAIRYAERKLAELRR